MHPPAERPRESVCARRSAPEQPAGEGCGSQQHSVLHDITHLCLRTSFSLFSLPFPLHTCPSLTIIDQQNECGHADLHPGNLLVRVVDPNSTWGRIAHFCNLKTAPHLVLLDVGMTCEMSAYDQENIVQFFQVCPWPHKNNARNFGLLGSDAIDLHDPLRCRL